MHGRAIRSNQEKVMEMKKVASAIGTVVVVLGVLTVFAPTPAHARPCVIRCSDAAGCVTCCVQKGGWVCQ